MYTLIGGCIKYTIQGHVHTCIHDNILKPDVIGELSNNELYKGRVKRDAPSNRTYLPIRIHTSYHFTEGHLTPELESKVQSVN